MKLQTNRTLEVDKIQLCFMAAQMKRVSSATSGRSQRKDQSRGPTLLHLQVIQSREEVLMLSLQEAI